ncbi:MAG TPA: DNA methyltransferase, partial [Thermoanaerobaculia bacterium]|nr:DNA methyltransferase [Thermoanaerobaculia bacterium]
MITATRLRNCTSRDSLFALLAELGLPVAPVAIDAEAWRRAGIELSWNGNASLFLAARFEGVDAYVIDGRDIGDDDVRRFLRSLSDWNAMTKYVAFVRDEPSHRISLYDLSPRRELRRLDADVANPTVYAVDRLNLLATNDTAELPRLLDRALDRETLTRHFFERFRDAVADVAEALRATIANESDDAINAHALLLLSRLLFLYFIQEKGWLSRERRFLVDRLVGCIFEGSEFFTCVLRPLFFGCLNTPIASRTTHARALGALPYLNGGLFEPSPFEERHPSISLPNELMSRVIDDVFERFAFRIDEGDAAGTHVDPEMLGKVFESLMAADDRAASGSFYTPKAIVDVLTRRAICEWLAGPDTATRDALQALASGPRASSPAGSESVSLSGGGETPPHQRPGRPRSEVLLRRLETITILDPACGSGAFLLSSLAVIERLTIALAAIAGTEVSEGVELRRAIVERSLFGVDVKAEAVRLCELRLWLAIVAATDGDIEDVQPLPNLDRNILQGNSLLSPTDFLGDARADVYRDWVLALRTQSDLVRRYRHATRDERPALCRLIRGNDLRIAAGMLARAIENDEQELQRLAFPHRDLFGRLHALDDEACGELHERVARNRALLQRVEEGELSFFSFDVHFAPVMSAGGFDVVAGNPPWVR